MNIKSIIFGILRFVIFIAVLAKIPDFIYEGQTKLLLVSISIGLLIIYFWYKKFNSLLNDNIMDYNGIKIIKRNKYSTYDDISKRIKRNTCNIELVETVKK